MAIKYNHWLRKLTQTQETKLKTAKLVFDNCDRYLKDICRKQLCALFPLFKLGLYSLIQKNTEIYLFYT